MSITPVTDAELLGPIHYVTDWTDPPQAGPLLNLPFSVDRSLSRWLYEEVSIEIDIAGPPVSISRCSTALFNYNLGGNEGVLLGDNLAGRLPVHLYFRTPVKALGTQVSAIGPVGRNYLAQCSVRTDDGQWWAVPPQSARLSRKRGTAPFLGASARPGRLIDEAWFDVVDPVNRVDFLRVAIGGLCFVPAA